MNNTLAKTVALGEAMQPEFEEYARQTIVNAKKLAEELMGRGFKLITNGTDNHLILADVQTSFGVDGKVVEETLDKIGLTLNKNAIPDDELSPFAPSGIRLGTPAMTTRGLREEHMAQIAEWMKKAIDARDSEKKLEMLKLEVRDFSRLFSLPA